MSRIAILSVFTAFLLLSCGNTATTSPQDEDKADIDTVTTEDEQCADDSDTSNDDTDTIDTGADADEETSDDDILSVDDDFLTPNLGVAFTITSRVLKDRPGNSGLAPKDYPEEIYGGIITETGEHIPLTDKKSSYITPWKSDQGGAQYMLVMSTAHTKDADYYLQIITAQDTLKWMTDASVNEIAGMHFYLYLYKAWYENNGTLFLSCPIAIGDQKDASRMYVDVAEKTWEVGEKETIKCNTGLVFDKRKIVAFLRGAKGYHSLCSCYEKNATGFTQRACTAEDVDIPPDAPVWPSPRDGEMNVNTAVKLSWNPSVDPDGGSVTYSVAFGTDNPPTTVVVDHTDKTEYTPSLKVNTRYFWQVTAFDDDGNSTKSAVWTFDTTEQTTHYPNHDLLIVVSPETADALKQELHTYRSDNQAEAISDAILEWQPGSATVLRDILKQHATQYGTKGAVLIGDMPAAWFEQVAHYGGEIGDMYEQFPSDIFLADLDGTWEDTDHNGMYDVHPNISAELYISRIPGTVAQLKEYFARDHQYRSGETVAKSRSFFCFMDDDWNSFAESTHQTWGLEDIYQNNYIYFEDEETSTKDKYTEQMRGDGAEFVYQWIHSSPHAIYFDNNYSPNPSNILTIGELESQPIYGSFYNLFNCSASRFTEEGGTLAISYLHSAAGLATFGSTKTGGSYQPEIFNATLANGGTWGAAWKNWINDTFSNGEYDQDYLDSWWLGMVILGDPLLRLTEPPTDGTVVLKQAVSHPKLTEKQKKSLRRFLQQGIRYQNRGTFEQYKALHPKFFTD